MTKRLWTLIALIALPILASCATGRSTADGGDAPAAYHYQMGLSYLGEQDYTAALIELTTAEKKDPDNPDLLYNLSLAYIGKKRHDLAEPKLLRAISLRSNFSAARNDLGVVFLELKKWDNAIQQFKIAKDDIFYTGSENAAINLGLAYLGKGDFPQALEELRAVAVSNPRNPIIRLSLGRVLFAMDKTDAAISEYRKAIDLYKDYGAAYYYLGLAQLKSNNRDAAKASFKEVLRIFPDSDLGHKALEHLDLLK